MKTKGHIIPKYLRHYHDYSRKPFLNLSELTLEEMMSVHKGISKKSGIYSKRNIDYYLFRRKVENTIRDLFILKGGEPQRKRPHYMVLGKSEWLKRWHKKSNEVIIPLEEFSDYAISFTYGDSYSTFSIEDGKPYRGVIYNKFEIKDIIINYGLPKHPSINGKRYIEAQVWDDKPVERVLRRLSCESQ